MQCKQIYSIVECAIVGVWFLCENKSSRFSLRIGQPPAIAACQGLGCPERFGRFCGSPCSSEARLPKYVCNGEQYFRYALGPRQRQLAKGALVESEDFSNITMCDVTCISLMRYGFGLTDGRRQDGFLRHRHVALYAASPRPEQASENKKTTKAQQRDVRYQIA